MTATDETRNDAADFEADEVTMAASDDVVAQIRAQAKKLRAEANGAAGTTEAPEALQVWTADAADDGEVDDVDGDELTGPPIRSALPEPVIDLTDDDEPTGPSDDELRKQVAAMPTTQRSNGDELTGPPVGRRQAQAPVQPAPAPTGSSLIDGLTPPESTATFWNAGEQITPTPRLVQPQRRARGVPLWILVVAVAAVIVLAAVGIALALASTGPIS